MKTRIARTALAAAPRLFWAIFIVATVARGQTLEVLHTFEGGADGALPSALVLGMDGNFYGTTGGGGANGQGTMFKMTPDGGVTTLHSFDTNGYPPEMILGSDDNFYGTSAIWSGNYTEDSAVFKMTADGAVTQLAFFGGIDNVANYTGTFYTHSVGPMAEGRDGNFYGTTLQGGSPSLNYGLGYGAVFKMTPEGALTTVASFGGGDYGQGPNWIMRGRDGNFYGTTLYGGDASYGSLGLGPGTLFEVTTNGILTVVVAFNFAPSTPPTSVMQASDGNFYVTTHASADLTGSGGTVLRVTPTGQLTTVVSFDDLGYSVGYANPLIQATDGNLYGTTSGWDQSAGIVFKIMPDGTWATLTSLAGIGAQGNGYQGALVQGADGNLYGTTESGGDLSIRNGFGGGTIFRIVLPPTHLPPLSLVLSGGAVLITWPASATNAVLEMTDVLPPSWMPVPISPVQIGDQMAVTVNIDSQSKFFRLSQQ